MALSFANPITQKWFRSAFDKPTQSQTLGWPAISGGSSTLILAPTGSGKTLTAFTVAIDKSLFAEKPHAGVRTLYISPLRALGVDIERNLRQPLAGIKALAKAEGVSYNDVRVGVRSGDTPSRSLIMVRFRAIIGSASNGNSKKENSAQSSQPVLLKWASTSARSIL